MKILMIGAHQDDNEFRCGGLAHKYVKMGYEVRFLSLCNGCGGHHIMTPAETTARRAKESAAVAKLLGIRYDVWEDMNDCSLMPTLENRRRLIRYIREFSPDLIISHRTNDYHADHRAAGMLLQDASYMLIVPHECPDVPAMTKTPIIMYNEDSFTEPDFHGDIVLDMDDENDLKLQMAHLNVSQVYEWLPYTKGYADEVPESDAERFEWLKGPYKVTPESTDEEILAASRGGSGYDLRNAQTASRFRKELIERYGEERASKIRYAEAFQLCPYGGALTPELNEKLFNL